VITPVEHTTDTRPATKATWWLWIAASAAIPILGILRDVLWQRKFGQHFPMQGSLVLWLFLVAAAAPAIIQWAVLRRLIPGLSFGIWVGACWLSAIFALFLIKRLRNSGFDGELWFDIARRLRSPGESSLAWPWVQLTLHAAAVALLYNLVPMVVLGWYAKRSMRIFLAATIIGACAAVVLHKVYSGFTFLDVRSLYSGIDFNRAQAPWSDLIQYAATVGLFGMVQGAIGGLGLMYAFAPDTNRRTPEAQPLGAAAFQVFGLVALVLVAAQVSRYAAGPSGIKTGFPEIRRLWSSAPAGDRSEGARILSFAHKIALPMAAWYAMPSPDGRTVLVLTKDQSLRRLDVKHGVFTNTSIAAGESARSVAFSPDGRYVAVNQQGRRRSDGDFNLGRIRLFSAHGFVEIKDFWNEEQNCAFSGTMTFSEDSRAIWVMCERPRAKPRDLLAVKLQLPDLQIIERWPAPDVIAGKGSASFADIMANESGTFVATFEQASASLHLFVMDVTNKVPVFASRDVAAADLGGPGFGVGGLHLSRDTRLMTLAHPPLPGTPLKGDFYRSVGQFRTFDTGTGNLVANFGHQSPGEDIIQWSLAFDRAHGRFAGLGSTLASQRGVIVLWDQRTGKELQRIETAAYRAGSFSLDGRWLAVLGRDDDAIYFYQAAP
jgi:hypothetical protein